MTLLLCRRHFLELGLVVFATWTKSKDDGMLMIERGAKRTAKPDIFISHNSRDKAEALKLATTLNYCAADVWLDDWELEVGQSLTDEIAGAMDEARYIAILITENYNKTVWTKTEYKRALAREQKEQRTVMLHSSLAKPRSQLSLKTKCISIYVKDTSVGY
jgi:hypothetical protein